MIVWMRDNKAVNRVWMVKLRGKRQVSGRLCSETEQDWAINWMTLEGTGNGESLMISEFRAGGKGLFIYFLIFIWLCWVLVEVHGLSCFPACGILAPQPGIEPAFPALQGGFLNTGPPGKS